MASSLETLLLGIYSNNLIQQKWKVIWPRLFFEGKQKRRNNLLDLEV